MKVKAIPAPYTVEELRKSAEQGVRRAIGIQISEPAALAAHKVAALLETIYPEYELYKTELLSLEPEARFVWGLMQDPGEPEFDDLKRYQQNVLKDLVASELKKQKRNVAEVGKILGEHVGYMRKLPQDRRDEFSDREAEILEQNPTLAATLSELAAINEYKIAAALETVVNRGAGIVEIAKFIRENILNLAKKSLIARHAAPKTSNDENN